jgi:hypothetical protein
VEEKQKQFFWPRTAFRMLAAAVRPMAGERRGSLAWDGWRQAAAWSLGTACAVAVLWHVSSSAARSELANAPVLGLQDTGYKVEGAQRDRLHKALEDLRLVCPASRDLLRGPCRLSVLCETFFLSPFSPAFLPCCPRFAVLSVLASLASKVCACVLCA